MTRSRRQRHCLAFLSLFPLAAAVLAWAELLAWLCG